MWALLPHTHLRGKKGEYKKQLQQMARGWVVRTDGGVEDLYPTLDENPAVVALREQVHSLFCPREDPEDGCQRHCQLFCDGRLLRHLRLLPTR